MPSALRARPEERKEIHMKHAIIVTGGKQYRVAEGDVIFVEKLDVEAGEAVKFDKVLAVIDGENTVLWSIIVYGFPWVGGTSFLIYLAGLNNIPDSVLEAAKLDGISAFGRIFKIDLPLIMGQIKYFIVMGIIGGIQGYTIQYAITNGGPGLNYTSMVPGYYMYKAAMNDSRYGYSCAVGLVLFVVILAVTLINNKLIKTEDY